MRQLKNFLRHRKAQMLACDCGCRTLKCWRESTCDCAGGGDSPTPPTPGFTYTFNKTTTRGRTDKYTAEKYVTGEDIPVGSYTLSVKYGNNDEGFEEAKIGDGTDWRSIPNVTLHNTTDIMKVTYVGNAEAALSEGTQEAYKAIYEDYENFMTNDANNLYFGVYWIDNNDKYVSVGIADGVGEQGIEGYDVLFNNVYGTIAQNYGCDSGYNITVEQAEAVYNIAASDSFKGTQADYKRLYQAAEDLYHSFWEEYNMSLVSNGYMVYRFDPYETDTPAEEYVFNYSIEGTTVLGWTISNGTTEREFDYIGTFGNTLKSKSDTAAAAGTQEAYGQLFASYKEAYTNNGTYLYDIYYNETSEIAGETYRLYTYRGYTPGTVRDASLIFNVNGQGELTEAYSLEYSSSEAEKNPIDLQVAAALISQTEHTIATGTQAAYEDTVEYAIDLLNVSDE